MTIDSQLHAAYSIYREFPVSTRLAARSLCFWTQNIVGLKGDYRHRVLPDGCADIVFINDEEPMVVGPWTEPFDVSLIKGTRIFGIRMHPGCAADVLGLPASELLNQSVPLREVCRQLSVRFDQMREPKVGPAKKAVLAEAALTALEPIRPLDGSATCATDEPTFHELTGPIDSLRQRLSNNFRIQPRGLLSVLL